MSPDPLVGRMLLGRFRVVERMAKGGMGVVYLARSEGAAGFTKPVVVKRILPELDEKEMVGMFVREARWHDGFRAGLRMWMRVVCPWYFEVKLCAGGGG